MSNKYRSQPAITKQTESNYNDDGWVKQLESSLNKVSVQPVNNLFDQISSVMNNSKSKHSSVQAAVDDMMQRSGLTNYLDNVKKATVAPIAIKTAQDKNQERLPQVIKDNPNILKTLENIINDGKGNLSVPAIIYRLRSLHINDVSDDASWEDEKLIHLVSLYNLRAKKDNPGNFDQQFSNLGINERGNTSETDAEDQDAFHILTPAKI